MPTPSSHRPAQDAAIPREPKQAEELRRTVEAELIQRKVIQEFVRSQLKENVDYGTIAIGGRATKPTLFKPGMEKIFSLFQITSRLRKDDETLSMISAQNLIAYKCELHRNEQFIGEGRGACAVSEKSRVNDAIKIAEKRARMDACLNLGFSEYFTQDLEDMEEPATDVAVPLPVSPPAQEEASGRFDQEVEPEVLEFAVKEKKELTSRTGSPYARLTTDHGTVIAFKNTMGQFQPNHTYLAPGIWESRNGSNAFVVTATTSQVRKK